MTEKTVESDGRSRSHSRHRLDEDSDWIYEAAAKDAQTQDKADYQYMDICGRALVLVRSAGCGTNALPKEIVCVAKERLMLSDGKTIF